MKKIQTRLTIAFFLIIALFGIQGIVAYQNIRSISNTQKQAFLHRLEIKRYEYRLAQARLLVFKIIGTLDPEKMDTFRSRFSQEQAFLRKVLADEGIDPTLIDLYFQVYDRVITLHYDFRLRAAQSLINQKAEEMYDTLVKELDRHSHSVQKQSEESIRQVYRKTLEFTFGILVAGLTAACVMAFILARTLIDREQAERQLRASENKYRNILDNTTAVVFIKDLEGKYLFVNKKFETLHGITDSEIQGLTDHDVFPSELAAEFRANDLTVLESDGPITVEEKEPRKDGIHLVLSTKFPLRDLNQQIYAICGIATDISALKAAEKELTEQKERAERYLNLAGVMFIGFDIKGQVTLANRQACRILECCKTDIMGLNWFDHFLPEGTRLEAKLMFGQVIAGEVPPKEYHETTVISKTGKARVIAWHNAYMTDDSGDITGALSAGDDITDKLELEAQLQQAQKMESIGNLAGGIAHEFNNILSIIMGNNDQIMDDLPEWSLSRKNSEAICVASLRARDIVKLLLTFSRQDDSIKKSIDIGAVVKESVKLIRATTPTNIEIREKISPDCCAIFGDSTQINQVMMNLCNNAIDALPISGGRIDIALCNSEITQENGISIKPHLQSGQYIKLSVSDNGSGIDAEILKRIFEPYFTTKDIGEGSGIGLAVVHGIIENHGGRIVCESAIGQGTTFTILIPAYEGPLVEELEKPAILHGKGENILYVDDEPSIAELGRLQLESLGYDAFSTTDPVEALDLIKSEPGRFDLVISDMAMPNLPGDQLIAKILSINPKMPTIICSGYSSRMSETKASEMGIKAFVMKPLDKNELAEKVREVLDSSKQS